MIDSLRQDALQSLDAAIAAADPYAQTLRCLEQRADRIKTAQSIHILAAGKAAISMMRAALAVVPAAKRGAVLAVTNYENEQVLDGVTVFGASHPLPDAAGEKAAAAIETAAHAAEDGDLVICLISGGASALLPAPVEGVSLVEKIATTDLLLKSGADITAMNKVRKALSRLKGGGLARAIGPADCISLILSDVPGDDLGTIASGPTVIEPPAGKSAKDVAYEAGIWDRLAPSVQKALNNSSVSTAGDVPADLENLLIGSNALSVKSARGALESMGYEVTVLSDWLEGDAVEAARRFLYTAQSTPSGKRAIIAGGETAVQVRGTGLGGRNQHMALAFALEASGTFERPHVFVSAGTDGRDGPTDAAGGIVDPSTMNSAKEKGVDLGAFLANDDSYHGLKAVDGLVVTGATGTNVADIQLLLLG